MTENHRMSQQPGCYRAGATGLFNRDEVQSVLSGAFYAPMPQTPVGTDARAFRPQKPDHYKIISISMYVDDLAKLDEMVDSLKSKGFPKANRSSLIRHALSQVDLDSVPKGL